MSTHTREDEQAYQLQVIQQEQRLKANLQILDLLKDYFLEHPDYRFGQALHNLNIATHLACYDKDVGTYHKDIFFQESKDLLYKFHVVSSEQIEKEIREAQADFEKEFKPKFIKGFETPIDKELIAVLE
jgi:hypothetical protein